MSIQRRKIIETIRRLHSSGEPLNISAVKRSHPELIRAVYDAVPFWGWKRALEDAGIDYSKIKVELEDVIECELCGKSFQRLPTHFIGKHQIQPCEYLMDYPGTEMVSETLRARITTMESSSLPHWEPIWSREYILDRLAEYHRRGFSLNQSEIRKIDVPLIGAVRSYIGSWRNVLKAARFDPRKIVRKQRHGKYMTAASVTRAIRDRAKRRWALHTGGVCMGPRRDGWLYNRGRRYFGSWAQALRAAGINPEEIMRGAWQYYPGMLFLDKNVILDAIRRRRRAGRSMSASALYHGSKREHRLYLGAIRMFGTWTAVLDAAGLDRAAIAKESALARRTYRNADEVIGEIRSRLQRKWKVNHATLSLGSHADRALLVSGLDYFGSWDKALTAAGVDLRDIRRTLPINYSYPDKQSITTAIRKRQADGFAINLRSVTHGKDRNSTLIRAARSHFGSWDAALSAAGIDLTVLRRAVRHGRALKMAKRRRYPDKASVLKGIRERQAKKLPLNPLSHSGVGRNVALWNSATDYFGSWDAALIAAGVDLIALRRAVRHAVALKLAKRRSYPDKASVIKGIRDRRAKRLPLNPSQVSRGLNRHKRLLRCAIEYFGSWAEALRSAGLDPESIYLRAPRQSALEK